MTSQKTATSGSYGRGWFANFQKLVSLSNKSWNSCEVSSMMLKKTLQNIFWKEDALRRIHGSSPLTNYCNAHIDQYLKKQRQSGNEIWSVNRIYPKQHLWIITESYTKCDWETIPRPFFKKLKLSISLDQYDKVLCILLLLFANLRTIEIDWN